MYFHLFQCTSMYYNELPSKAYLFIMSKRPPRNFSFLEIIIEIIVVHIGYFTKKITKLTKIRQIDKLYLRHIHYHKFVSKLKQIIQYIHT